MDQRRVGPGPPTTCRWAAGWGESWRGAGRCTSNSPARGGPGMEGERGTGIGGKRKWCWPVHRDLKGTVCQAGTQLHSVNSPGWALFPGPKNHPRTPFEMHPHSTPPPNGLKDPWGSSKLNETNCWLDPPPGSGWLMGWTWLDPKAGKKA